MHRIKNEGTLVNFSFCSNTSTPPVYLSLFKVALKDRVVWVDFKAHTIWFLRYVWKLSLVQRPRFSLIEVESQKSALLVIFLQSWLIVNIVVKRTQLSVNIFDKVIVYVLEHIVIVIYPKGMIKLLNQRVESIFKFWLYVQLGLSKIRNHKSWRW